MRGSRVGFLTSLVAMVVLSGMASAAGLNAWPVWPGYHADMVHNGRNPRSTDITNPASLGLVWVFPRADAEYATEEDSTVDDNPISLHRNWFYENLGKWTKGTNEDAYEVDDTVAPRYRYMQAVPSDWQDHPGKTWVKDKALWYFPYGDTDRKSVSLGYYRVWVWVPAQPDAPNVGDPTFTHKAKYIVHDDNGDTEVTFDQTEGGTWQLLTDKQFSFQNAAKTRKYFVELSNETGDTYSQVTDDSGNIIIHVAADAVKFVRGTGMEIYSSPVSATIDYSWTHDPAQAGNYPMTQYDYTGKAPVVFVGTVEPPLANSANAPNTGAIYCINSVTPTTTAFSKGTDGKYHSNYEELSKNLGKDIWRYPNRDPNLRDALEGPIEGGIYSSPTLAHVSLTTGGDKLVCYVSGMDRQIYALDAETGTLLWKGPGVTVSESPGTGWAAVSARDDAFGGQFCYSTGSENMQWNFQSVRDNARDMSKNGDGWAYAIYAWLPTARTGEAARTTVKYIINHQGSNKSVDIKINQALPENQGRWVKIGSSYYNVDFVTLEATPGAVADAMMIVPDTIGPFGYCSPVADISAPIQNYPATEGSYGTSTGGDIIAEHIYAVTSNGRALSFAAGGSDKSVVDAGRKCWVEWVYPSIRTSRSVTGSGTDDKPSMGQIGASPAYNEGSAGKLLFMAGLDGKIRCVNAINGEEIWTYQDTQTSTDPFGGTIGFGGFTSTPTIDEFGNITQLFIGSTSGYFYCLNAGTGALNWRYPDKDSTKAPLGAFRYSTAVVGDSPFGTRMHRVWIGSSDGHIYTFSAEPTFTPTTDWPDRRIWVENVSDTIRTVHGPTGLEYIEPSLLSPIQGSVACDGAASSSVTPNSTMTMYVGDMNGMLHWYSADTGRSDWTFDHDSDINTPAKNYATYQTEGELFSSPNVTNFSVTNSIVGLSSKQINYVYVGSEDGRIYAFSNYGGAWGGSWAGGHWPFGGDPYTDDSRKIEKLAPNAEVQFDIFPCDFSERSNNYNPEPKSGDTYLLPTDPSTDWTSSTSGGEWIVSEEMKAPSGIADATSATDDDAIDETLRTAALERRNEVFPSLTSRAGNSPLYFEWGETINLALWNLPELSFLSGSSNSSKRGSIRLNMTNTSAGESGGSQVKMAGRIKQLKEYTVLKSDATPLHYSSGGGMNGSEVKRSYVLATIEINTSGRQPPSPGPGWTLTAEIRTKIKSNDKTYTTRIIPIARLIAAGSSGSPEPFVADDNYQEQLLGVNNPLAIRDDGDKVGGAVESLAWPNVTGYPTDRSDPEAHYNGNAVGDNLTLSSGKMPVMNLGIVNHGASSREGWLGVMDRSATGTKTERGSSRKLDNFRISAGELRFNGGDDGAIEKSGGTKFPWEFGAGSVDYPNIYKQRQGYRKATDDGDPANASTVLPSVFGTSTLTTTSPVCNTLDYDDCTMRPETVFVSVNVPRFQPANCGNTGYSRDMEAFIDSNRNGQWDSGNVIIGRPSTYQEAYRRFVAGIRVPPDPKIEVEEKMIDVGSAPHGLGEGLTGDYEFSPYNPTAEIRQWFRPVTIKNAGNVNLPNMYIGRTTKMLSDQAGAISPIPEGAITSSLDWSVPSYELLQPFKSAPFVSGSWGYTLTKARVGDPDPSVMTIPDKRKWDMNYGGANVATEFALTSLNTAFGTDLKVDKPLPVKVGVRVPLTQPIGGYYSFDSRYRLPYVPVFADTNRNGALDPTVTNLEPVAETSFQLKAAVRENQLTGGVTPMTLPQIDIPDTEDLNGNGLLDNGEDRNNNLVLDDFTPRVGDATPAAFRDPTTGDVHLFWSSNRMFDTSLYPTSASGRTEFASAPWFIDRATLHWDEHGSTRTGWQTSGNTPDQWWIIPAVGGSPQLPVVQWPTLEGSGSDPNLMPWNFNGASTGFYSVRHHSPVVARKLTAKRVEGGDPAVAGDDTTWLAWVGTADMQNSASGKVTQDHIIHYKNATGGIVTGKDSYISHDPGMVKRHPSLAIYDNRMWMFWQGGNKGNWSIMYSTNDDPKHDSGAWANDATLITPDCLTSVSSPNCIFRRFWGNLTGNTPDYAASKPMLDIIYAGTSKYGQSPDILLGRYVAANQKDANDATTVNAKSAIEAAMPGSAAQPLPRVFNEQMRRDSKYGYFTSQHLAWFRPNVENPVVDMWSASAPDVPYVHVIFPVGYDLPGFGVLSAEAVVSATDGSIVISGATQPAVDPQPLVPILDDATGIYTYKYPNAMTSAILGEMLVDFSAGVIRFTQPLNEVKVGDKFVSPTVLAEYTPRTWRLTTDAAVDNSPRAFIERTDMNETANPGMVSPWQTSSGTPKPAPVDRLWVFWRKAGTGVNTSTIYYKTYRVGVDLAKLGHKPIPVATDYSSASASPGQVLPTAGLDVQNELGPWEVNRTGTKIYFSEVDERYKSLVSGSWDVLAPGQVNPITIKYTPEGASSSVTVNAYDVYWIEELPEQSLFGFSADGNVNEGGIYAFYDPKPEFYSISAFGSGTWEPIPSSKIWVFWTSTRGGTSDLFWETLSPNFSAD